MDRLTELLADLQKEFSQGNRLERELSRADVDTSDLIKNDPLLLEGLLTAGTLPIAGASAVKFAISNRQLPSWLAPFTSRFGGNEMGLLKTRSGSGVGTDVVGRSPMPKSKAPITTKRGPRGPINIEQPIQGNLDLTKLKDTGITSLGNRMNPRMREDLLGRRDRIQQDIFKMNSMQRQGEPVDINRLFRLQDELDALNKTLK